MIIYGSLDEAYRSEVRAVLSEGIESAPRGQWTKEVLGRSFRISNPRCRVIRSKARKWSLAYALGEFFWHVSGSSRVDHIAFYSPFWNKFGEPDGSIRGSCYGHRIFGDGGREWLRAKGALQSDPHTRRAQLVLADSGCDLSTENSDVPCCSLLQFVLREGKLDLIVYMRSNDAILGFGYDVFLFTMLQEMMATELGLQLGWYQHVTGSFHIYEKDVQLARELCEEPHSEAVSMQPMRDIEELYMAIEAEKAIRQGHVGSVEELSHLSTYWLELVKVLLRHSLVHQRQQLDSSFCAVGQDDLAIT